MILITLDDTEDAEELYKTIAGELPSDAVQLSKASRGFEGVIQSDVIILAATIAPVVAQKIAGVLVNLMKANAERQVSINGATIRGYSADEVARILASAPARGQPRQENAD
jgi:hypothetical protein